MEGNLPWALVFTGVFIAIVVELIGIPVLPFAIGVYLPVHLNACIMVGGLVRLAFDKMNKKEEDKKRIVNDGVLFCSGMIAGEGLVGILLALLAIITIDGTSVADILDLSKYINLPGPLPEILSLVVFAGVILCLLKFSLWRKPKHEAQKDAE